MKRVQRFENPVKDELFRMGRAMSVKFLEINDLDPIPLTDYRNEYVKGDTGRCDRKNGRTKILVDVPMTALPRHVPVCCMRSYPASKIDRTAMGVVAHETGHHCEFVLADRRKFNYAKWKLALQQSNRVSGYEPNHHEAFAETMRLFILNPNLLLAGAPARYEFIRSVLNLQPSEPRDWRTILPKSYHQDCLSWIAKN